MTWASSSGTLHRSRPFRPGRSRSYRLGPWTAARCILAPGPVSSAVRYRRMRYTPCPNAGAPGRIPALDMPVQKWPIRARGKIGNRCRTGLCSSSSGKFHPSARAHRAAGSSVFPATAARIRSPSRVRSGTTGPMSTAPGSCLSNGQSRPAPWWRFW